MANHYYRVKEVWYAESTLRLKIDRYHIKRKTPCGVWIDTGYSSEKFILTKARKKWACPTEEEAIESFKFRKRRQVKILKAQLERAQQALNTIEADSVEFVTDFNILN